MYTNNCVQYRMMLLRTRYGVTPSVVAEAQWKCATGNWKSTKSSEYAPASLKAEQGPVEYAPSLAQSLTRVVGYAPYVVERESRQA